MICRYEFKNYKSFKDFSILDLLAPANKVKNRFLNNFNKTEYGLDILKTAVIVGENAGGKTNLIGSLNFLKSLFKINEKIGSFKNLINTNNICSNNPDECNTTQEFSLDILINNKLYFYVLKIDYLGIIFESLSLKTSLYGKKQNIFIVSRDQITKNKKLSRYVLKAKLKPDIIKAFDNIMKSSESLGLFINKFALLGNKHSLNFVNYINNNLYAEKIFRNIKNG